jgi:glutathione S-transferase
MITLYQPPAKWGLACLSPFGTKLETWLRMAGLPYEKKPGNPMQAPKGKVPYVGIDGELVGDSQLIIERLAPRAAKDLDAGLSAEQRAIGHVVRKMLEESTYFIVVYFRWITDEGFAVYAPVLRTIMPLPLVVLPMARRSVRAALRAQGTGRHSRAELAALGAADLTAVSGILGDRPYLLGAEPTTVDASVYAALSSILYFPADSELRTSLRSLPNLVAYTERMQRRYFPELPTE